MLDFRDVVSELNEEFYNKTNEDGLVPFVYKSIGGLEKIEFMGEIVFDTDNDLNCPEGEDGTDCYTEDKDYKCKDDNYVCKDQGAYIYLLIMERVDNMLKLLTMWRKENV